MAKTTTTVRIDQDTKDLLKELSKSDRRSMIDTLAILISESAKHLPAKVKA